jgi:hypothetical protein
MTNAVFAAARARLPDAPALVAGVREAVWVSQPGEAETLGLEGVAERLRRGAAPIVCPATLWAQKNHGVVWISTYTRNLQRQLDRELDRAYPVLGQKRRKVIVRKGRENLFCLLNFLQTSVGPFVSVRS